MLQKARDGRHVLLIAPPGGGKTLAGFLPTLVELHEAGPARPEGVHTLYLSPLKALAVDVERNLMEPIRGMGLKVAAESRTGDTGVARRQRQRVQPPDILLTTPEQLALFCAWPGAREYFSGLKRVIIDEAHSLYGSKRGDLLNLGLARLNAFAPNLQRVGLSATVNEPELLRRWLGARSPSPSGVGQTGGAGLGGEPSVRRGTAPHPVASRPPSPDGEGEWADLVLGAPGAPAQIDVLISEGKVPWAGPPATIQRVDI